MPQRPNSASTQGRPLRTTLNVPILTLGGRVDTPGGTVSPAAHHRAHGSAARTALYDDNAVIEAWQNYAAAHPTAHVLVNTMRTARPVRVEQTDTFTVTVVNNIQVDTINENMADILSAMRDSLGNDAFTIEVRVSDGPASPDTWNEHEVLSYMIEHNPALAQFISDMGLVL